MQAYILREKFLNFFKSKKHKIVESDSLAPKDDPTVLFTPAGMNQFKKEFLGFDSGFSRAATVQRCLRTDDLEKVGRTSGHHTFFEMLGNFSFGDYFKKEAISFAWEFLTKELKVKEEKLWVSVYKDDAEAYGIWRNTIKIPENRIIKLGDKENFWPSEAKEKGPNGPCGPCSEIFYDQGTNIGCRRQDCNPSCNCGRFLEVWNLVFTQYNRRENGLLEPLPNRNIDTGMGLERLAAVMQGVPNNFETDLFKPLINEIIFEARNDNPENRPLIYAIADHVRAVSFAIYDGILPSNETRGYVVRKLIRKSTLHLRALGTKQPFLYKLVPVLAEIMNPYYPELQVRKENIAEIILAEEKSFIASLNSSDSLFKEKFHDFIKKSDPDKVGKVAFQLYDTYGIPFELTIAWLDKNNINISKDVFNKELGEQRNRSKLQSTMKGDVFSVKNLDKNLKETKFLGYKDDSIKAKIVKLIKCDSSTKKIIKGDEAIIILDKTVFYPESGGQVGDKGEIVKGKNIFEVQDTKRSDKAIMHIGVVKAGAFKSSDLVAVKIDFERRMAIARNHTATHLLQAALRKILGGHVQQQGSLVGEEKFRFDFTHFKNIPKDQLDRIEELVNGYIISNYPVETKEMALAQAKKTGALAFFGEKYEGKVRVVSVGDFSKEFCGGSHLSATGQIGIFKILQENSVASGIRRIEAATGVSAYKMIKNQEEALEKIASILNVNIENATRELEAKLTRMRKLEKEENSQKMDTLKISVDAVIQNATMIKDIKVITNVFEDLNMDLLRINVDLIKEKTDNSVIALGSNEKGRALLVLGVTEDLCQKGMDASKLIKEISGIIGGSGGGRADFAQAGGNNPGNFEMAFLELKDVLNKLP